MGNRIDKELLDKIAKGSATDSEQEVFDTWLSTLDSIQYEKVLDDFEKLVGHGNHQHVVDSILWEKINLQVEAHEELARARRKRAILWLSAAASLLLVLSAAFFLKNRSIYPVPIPSVEQRLTNDILPGKSRAILELADGSKIVLDESSSAKIWEGSGVVVKKTKSGQLLYNFQGKPEAGSTEPVYHTISTPKGGQYLIVLPDGTRVSLNASSRLKFPTVFDGRQRRVEFSGEGYFEVVSDQAKPFVVQTDKETVKVLGTEFNVNAYSDDGTSRTTLVKGRVEVSPKDDDRPAKVLHPGQQSVIRGQDIQIVKVDTSEAVAWKNGEFMFNRESIESVMRKIARWYDVEIIYTKPIGDDIKIWGSVSRFDRISEVLKFIERTKAVHFKMEGRKVYVIK